ncbi:MAG: DUF342 domain-containing protein [Lachnospiraceae bacterium]|nr:DUF342 domain-containing protein [Lachnospiraceae bacterium]
MAENKIIQGGFGGIPNWLEIMISEDGMEASILIKSGNDIGIPMIQPIKDYLRRAGIQAHVSDKAIEHIVKRRLFDDFYLVAKGQRPIEGTKGSYEFFFKSEPGFELPKILPDGSVDFSDVITVVEPGRLLAEHHWPDKGEDGYKVTGEIVPAGLAQDVEPFRLSGVIQRGNRYFSQKAGKVTLRDKELFVEPVTVIENDIDRAYGDVSAKGDIFIKGDIWSGMHVETKGSIIVDGHVNGAHLTAGDDIIIGYGVNGEGKAILETRRNLICNYIENANVNADGDIVTGSIVNSNVYAGHQVRAVGSKGIIMGGMICGMTGICANVAGHRSGVGTKLFAAASEKNTEDLKRLRNSVNSYVDYLEHIEEEESGLCEAVERAGDTLTGRQMKQKLETVVNEKLQIAQKLDEVKWELNCLLKRIEYAREGDITVYKQVCEGVTMTIGSVKADLPFEGMSGAHFYRKYDRIENEPAEEAKWKKRVRSS